MLVDFANLTDAEFNCFRRRWSDYTMPKDNGLLLTYRNQLRQFWTGSPESQFAVKIWMDDARQGQGYGPLLPLRPHEGRVGVFIDYSIFPLALAMGATELAAKMAVCGNPECGYPYFLKGRKGQRFCDCLSCLAYGQRAHKRAWWAEHRNEQKKLRKKRSKHAKAKKA